jgi:hypothetical protein
VTEKQRKENTKDMKNMLAKAHADIASERKAMFIGLKNELLDLIVKVTQCIRQHELSDVEKLQHDQHAAEIVTKRA